MSNEFEVVFDRQAAQDLEAISDARVQRKLIETAFELRTEPLAKGKPLTGDLQGLRSLRAVGQRYRILYQVVVRIPPPEPDPPEVPAGRVTIVVIGIRKEGDKRDAYRVASKRLGSD